VHRRRKHSVAGVDDQVVVSVHEAIGDAHLPERVVDDRLHRGQDFITLLLRYLVPVSGHRLAVPG